MRRNRPGALLTAALFSAGLTASAREVLTPEEQAERELEAKKQAPPVLAVEPAGFRMEIKEDETRTVRLSVRNAGGGKLMWSVSSAPRWITFDVRGGDLGFDEERSLILTVDPVGTAEDVLSADIAIEAAGAEGSPASVPVSVTVHRRPKRPAPAEPEPPAAAPSQEEARRWRISAGMGAHVLLEGMISGPRAVLELRSGPHALQVAPFTVGPPFHIDDWKDGVRVTTAVQEDIRVAYRRYVGAQVRRSWFWEIGAAKYKIGAETEVDNAGPVGAEYFAAGGGIRLGTSGGRLFSELSLNLLTGSGAEVSVWNGTSESTRTLYQQYTQFAAAFGLTF